MIARLLRWLLGPSAAEWNALRRQLAEEKRRREPDWYAKLEREAERNFERGLSDVFGCAGDARRVREPGAGAGLPPVGIQTDRVVEIVQVETTDRSGEPTIEEFGS